MPKVLLVVGGGIETIPALERARQMGLWVVVSDMNPQAPGFTRADDTLIASTYDVEATVAAALRYHQTVRSIDGVISFASDVPLTVAAVAEALALPGIPMDAARLASDKLAMKGKFIADGVPVPWFSPVESAAQIRKVVAERGFPLVIKPVDSRGARGVLRLTPDVDLEWAYHQSASRSPSRRVMVEDFLAGPQISTESIVFEGSAYTPGFADRNYEYLERFAPHIIENGGDLPAELSCHERQSVGNLVQRAALSMGVHNGVVKGDIVLHAGGPCIIELAARVSGGYLSSYEIPFSTGVDFVGHAIRLALGEKVDPAELRPRFQRFVAQRYMFPSPGRVVRIGGVEKATRLPGVIFCQVRVCVGEVVGPVDSHPARGGLVIAMGDSRAQARERAEAAIQAVEIETAPFTD